MVPFWNPDPPAITGHREKLLRRCWRFQRTKVWASPTFPARCPDAVKGPREQ